MTDEDELATARYYDRAAGRVAYPVDSLRYRILAAGYAGDWDLVDSLEAEECYAARVTWRVEANDPLALAACINLSAGNGGIGE